MPNRRIIVWGTLLLALSLIAYGSFIETNQVEIHHVWISDRSLGKLLKKYTVVQLSDLHIDSIGQREQQVLKLLNHLDPDFIFLTGDYVKWGCDYRGALDFLSRLKAKIGIWGVLGDYDYSNSRKSCLFCHEKGSGKFTKRHPVHFLRDAFEILTLPEGSLLIVGINVKGEDHLRPVKNFSPSNRKEPRIILSHTPLAFDLFGNELAMLMLAGDTHGGQVPLPSWLLKLAGYEKNSRYSQGLFEKGRSKMFVSRGIGTSHLPVRVCRRPEITVLHFLP
jgi:predicted MPP superfamily phosphohydrolase